MRVLVTGAAGFIGSHVVDRLLAMGHEVRALLRSASQASSLSWHAHPNVELCFDRFGDPSECSRCLDRIDTVVHLAATRSKSWQEQKKRTVLDTETLVSMAAKKDVKHFILISSYSIYDYTNIPSKSSIDEQSPLITDSKKYGPYPWAKLQQEETVRRFCHDTDLTFTILRLGAVYGPGAAWTHRLGLMKGRTWFRFGSTAKIPLVYVGNAADAITLSVDASNATNLTLNVVDDNCPTQHQYMAELKIFWNPKPIIVPFPFWALRLASVSIWALARCFGRQYHVPLTLRPMCLDAMAKPMIYPNDRIKHVLGWQPCVTRAEVLQHIFGKLD